MIEINIAPEELNLPFPLRPYQWEGVSFLLQSESALLADEMGLGKTVQTAIALQLMLQQKGFDRALIVVPASLALNWQLELERWSPDLTVKRVEGSAEGRAAYYELPFPVIIATYEQIRSDAVRLDRTVHFDVVVLDEAQRIKNIDSTTSFACRMLPRTRALALTGTPIENVSDDIVSIFQFLKPGLIYSGMPKPELHKLIKDHFLRRRKKDVLPELPPIIQQDVPLALEGNQREVYLDAWDLRRVYARSRGVPVSNAHLLALITKLKQLCNFEPISEESVKLDALIPIIESLSEPTDKIIIFSQYVKTLEWISDRLRQIPHALFHGSISEVDRDTIIKTFESEPGPRALLMSLRVGGVGLNLQAASTVVLFDRWWNPAVENQAIQRAHRFGREDPLQVFRFIVVDSIEERIQQLLRDKQELFDRFVDNAETADVHLLSRNELRKLLQIGDIDLDLEV